MIFTLALLANYSPHYSGCQVHECDFPRYFFLFIEGDFNPNDCSYNICSCTWNQDYLGIEEHYQQTRHTLPHQDADSQLGMCFLFSLRPMTHLCFQDPLKDTPKKQPRISSRRCNAVLTIKMYVKQTC